VPLDRVRLTAAKSGFGRHRKLRLARPRARPPVSASDDELRLARPSARTQPRPRRTTNSASPDPGLGLGLGSGRRRTPPRPTPGLGLSLGLRRWSPPRPTRGSDSTSTSEDRLDLDLGGASASPDPGLGPTTSQGANYRRFDPGGSLDRRVNCRRVPQPRWVGARWSAKGGNQRETGVKGKPAAFVLSHA
jgi:hypothetical protein